MIFRSPDEIPADFGPCAVTIGNFDGVHLGHCEIMRRVQRIAREHGWKAAVLTFDPHPSRVVAPDRAPRLLTTPADRACKMQEQGIDGVLILPFTAAVSQLSPEDFVQRILVEKLQARAVLIGDNFRFGHKASGHADTLRELGRKHGFETEVVPAVSSRGRIVSSTAVRQAIEEGNVSLACRLLGHPYTLTGVVVRGEGVGTKQTVPTLNLDTEAELLPKHGVYITRTRERNTAREWQSITNIGNRPTFNGQAVTIETYLLSPLEGPTPQEISVELLRRVRDERKFESPEALKTQIIRDVGRAQTYFRRLNLKTSAVSVPMSDNR